MTFPGKPEWDLVIIAGGELERGLTETVLSVPKRWGIATCHMLAKCNMQPHIYQALISYLTGTPIHVMPLSPLNPLTIDQSSEAGPDDQPLCVLLDQ